MTAVPAPSALWLAVITAADGQCQCDGDCGRRTHFKRCQAENNAETASGLLHLVPAADPGAPAEAAIGLPAAGLAAYCAGCHDRIARLRRPTPLAVIDGQAGLFGDAA